MCLFSTHDLDQGPAVLEARPGLLPQPADLLRAAVAAAGSSPPSTMPCGRAGICSWDRRRASPRSPACSRRSTSGIGSIVRRDARGAASRLSLLARAGDAAAARRARTPASDDIDRRAARAIARYAPAFLVVDQQHDILRFSGQTARYLEPATGRREPQPVHTCCTRICGPRCARRSSRPPRPGSAVRHEHIRIEAGEQRRGGQSDRRAASDRGERASLFVVAFQEVGAAGPATAGGGSAGHARCGQRRSRPGPRTGSLRQPSERLRNVTEELEAANEELQSSNEEYLSVNEELQSANEELETSKEELQSLNEELQTDQRRAEHQERQPGALQQRPCEPVRQHLDRDPVPGQRSAHPALHPASAGDLQRPRRRRGTADQRHRDAG